MYKRQDYGYLCQTIPDDCHYLCANNTIAAVCGDLGYTNLESWIQGVRDSLFVHLGNLGSNVAVNDTRIPLAPASTALGTGASTLLASGSPGISEEIQAIEICNPDPLVTATGVISSISIPASCLLYTSPSPRD